MVHRNIVQTRLQRSVCEVLGYASFFLIVSIESDLMEIIGQVWDIRRQMESEIIPYSMTKELLMMRVLTAECALEMRMHYEGKNAVL